MLALKHTHPEVFDHISMSQVQYQLIAHYWSQIFNSDPHDLN
jgi:hypothetical protein